MKKFVFLYNAGGVQNQEVKMLWMEWFEKVKEYTVDGGNPLVNGHSVTEAGVEKLTPENSVTTGYSIVNAEDMESAIELAKGCPNGLKVYEAMSM
jgi:hypothetical protein